MTDQTPGYHYKVIARALRIIDAKGPGLTLDALAAQLSMSPGHFQRLFSHWVGVSPKRYQQYLTLDHARSLLSEKRTLLDVAAETGLSGTGRLHDLFLTWEKMTPGEVARGGADLTVFWGWYDSPYGPAIAMGTDRGLCGLGFAAEIGEAEAFADLKARWPQATFVENPMILQPWVYSALGAKDRANAPTPLYLIGAPFQIKVWEALLKIPTGHVTTYGEIAQHIGSPKAVRAVGTAVGRNPISLLIPCHRAMRKSGGLGGYHWGLPVKRAMLARESAQEDAL